MTRTWKTLSETTRSLCWALLLPVFPLAAVASEAARPVLVMVESPSQASFESAVASLRSSGFRPLHFFPPVALIAWAPDRLAESARYTVEKGVYWSAVDDEAVRDMDAPGRLVAGVWNDVFMGRSPEGALKGETEAPLDDALASRPSERIPESGLGCPSGMQSLMVSEFMLGSVSLNVILPQSTGAVDTSTESWDEAREAQVLGGVVAGAQWLLERAPSSPSRVALSFTYHLYAGRVDARARTSYEPIARSADPTDEPGTGEGLWTNEILDAFGYAGYADRWAKSRAFDDDARRADGTDWAVTLFVADSLNDADGRFADNRFAYTWQPGSHIVMTYDNSGWGIARMGSVAAHEMSHAFWAKDEYSGSGCSCGQTSGYLAGENGNCAATCSSTIATCVMRSADLSGDAGLVCIHTARQIGWADDDADGIPDAVQSPPTIQIENASAVDGSLILTGSAFAQAAPNRDPSPQAYTCPITLARLASVRVRVNGGAWQDAAADGGSFSGLGEEFHFASDAAGPGNYLLELIAADTLGQTGTVSTTLSVAGPAPGPPPVPDGTRAGAGAMKSSRSADSITVTWDPTCGSAPVNLYWGDGDGLPRTPGGTYVFSGSACGLGTSGSFDWTASPDPALRRSRLIWWILVATDGGQVEGSWGKDSAGNERNGPQPSGQCGITGKETANPGC